MCRVLRNHILYTRHSVYSRAFFHDTYGLHTYSLYFRFIMDEANVYQIVLLALFIKLYSRGNIVVISGLLFLLKERKNAYEMRL